MKTTNTILVGGGVLAAVLFIGGKKKPSTKAVTPTPKEKLPLPDVDEPVTEDEKKYIDFYYTLGWYKLQEIDANAGTPPPNIVQKGTTSDAQWLTNIAYWAMYSRPNNEFNVHAPWDVWSVDHTNNWFKIWTRMYGYAKTLVPG